MQSRRGTERLDHGCDNQFRVYKGDKLVPSISFLTVAHSFTPVLSRIQDNKCRCLIVESSNMTEDDM